MPSFQERLRAAVSIHASGQVAPAENQYRELLKERPGSADVLHLLGVAAMQQNRREQAVDLIRQAIAADPKVAEYHSNLGIALDALERREEAIASYRQAIVLRPKYPEAHNNLAGTLSAIGQIEAAIEEYQLAVAQKPDYFDAWDNLGSTLRLAERNDEAIAAYDRAIALKPDFAYSHFNRGTLLLAMGDFQRGWDDLEWRWQCPTFGHPLRSFNRPVWAGEELHGKTILFHAEQGLGDTIHFVRYAAILAERGAHVIVEAQPQLAALLTDVPGVSQVMARGDALPEFDFHIPMMSVPRIVKTTVETIPADMPYILPPAIAHETWRAITRADARADGTKKLRVGLAWAGNPSSRVDARRSIALQMLASLADAPNVRFYSLQLGAAGKQIEAAPFPIIDHTAKLTNFVETAGLIANLDLVICVDTVIAHLAGAMNHKVWLLTYSPADWRWMFGRTDNPWYPSLRIFRQPAPGAWADPIERAGLELAKLANFTTAGEQSSGQAMKLG